MVVEWATSTNDPDLLGVDKCNIFVGGLNPHLIDEENLAERFEVYGEIESSTLVNRFANEEENKNNSAATQRSAFAFIRYKDESAASSAIENENGVDWLERRIRVQYCESQEMKNKRRANKYYQSYSQSNMYYPNSMAPHPIMMMGAPGWYAPPGYMYPPVDPSYSHYMMYPAAPWGYPLNPMDGEYYDAGEPQQQLIEGDTKYATLNVGTTW